MDNNKIKKLIEDSGIITHKKVVDILRDQGIEQIGKSGKGVYYVLK